jgi:hypothetical protein
MLHTSRFRNTYKSADQKSEEMIPLGILCVYEGIILKIMLRKQKIMQTRFSVAQDNGNWWDYVNPLVL